jgi:serine/threonine-protein phosphatase 5
VADLKRVLALEPNNATVKQQLESTQKLVRRIEFEKAIEVGEEKTAVERCLEVIAEGACVVGRPFVFFFSLMAEGGQGGCDVDKNYAGPQLTKSEEGKYGITREFVDAMIAWFKDGKALPKRYVWEIALGAFGHFVKEESLVDLPVGEGMTCDVIGDVHGERCKKRGSFDVEWADEGL